MTINDTIKALNSYRHPYKNWLQILLLRKLFNRKIIIVKFRNGKSILLPSELVYSLKCLIAMNLNSMEAIINSLEFDGNSGILRFLFKGKIVSLKFFDNTVMNGEFASFLGDYDFLEPIKNNIVVDIGANIGDSSISFAIEGAKKVVALEPYPYSYKWAVENIKLNNLENKIEIINAGYGEHGIIHIDDKVSTIGTVLEATEGGKKINLLSLNDIVLNYIRYLDGEILLKMDCEGCEYNILKEPDDVLKKFNRIVIEYHNGYENIKTKLESIGFAVEFTKPHIWYNKNTNMNLIQGYIYARR
ncbi:FkbM family methyltransferase [Ferroplasma acidiphilum]|jgi:FkbM family methyltransferase|uniref:FkbM family methyltransferase n=1 Tax=Ferroplasma acidiphilum TaxID=74969 RepID=UPI0023F2CBCB|nr:FkbM family methyltransferase [Ferroplasma acidiphilum]